ncbi:hypothetical protein GC207_06615 [bacterium]|nr:hypothetical protein [bacterium]
MSHESTQSPVSRRRFLDQTARGMTAAALAGGAFSLLAQSAGDRPKKSNDVTVIIPRGRVPIGMIIDDSTCLVNLNRFSIPQFDAAWGGKNDAYHRDWKSWSPEIPDSFVRKFGEWCAENGVKGKYSIVPYPACVGRVDRVLPGWSHQELQDSIKLVRELMAPNWDIHPEMVTHTRVIDLKTGQPYPEISLKYFENWDWTTGRSADEIAAYMDYALNILKNVGLPCEGITTPGGFGNKALPELSRATLQSVRDVYGAEIPHYFRHAFSEGNESVAPRVEYASDLDSDDPRCVVSVIACTSDWTGGWDNTPPGGPDKFISADGKSGRVVDIIKRDEPAMMLGHWTGIYWLGRELGFEIFKTVVGRLHEHYGDQLHWMKLAELSRYWAAKELTRVERHENQVDFHAPYACPLFTVQIVANSEVRKISTGAGGEPLKKVATTKDLTNGTWCLAGDKVTVCFDLPKGKSNLQLA